MTALWQPTWKALTAYSLTAVVIPVTFAGFTWRCTTAGTSGAVEPVWPDPSMGTSTIVDGTVTWTVGTGFRQATQAALLSLVTTFAAANPTIVRSIRTVRPMSFANVELPCFYIGDMSETDAYFSGLWQRTLSGLTCVLVDAMGSIDESNDRMNFIHDALADLFTLNYHAISGRSILQLTGIGDTEEVDGTTRYPALLLTFGQTNMQEGRI